MTLIIFKYFYYFFNSYFDLNKYFRFLQGFKSLFFNL